jgi:hypothetical protein
MKPQPEDGVERLGQAVGPGYSVIGLAIWASTFVYALALTLIRVFRLPQDPGGEEIDAAFLRLLAVLLAVVGIAASAGAVKLHRWLLRSGPEGRVGRFFAAGGRGGQAGFLQKRLERLRTEDPRLEPLVEAALFYLTATLVAASVAEAPAIFALVVALLALFSGAGLLADPLVFGLVLGLGLLSLAVKWLVVPRGGRLRAYLRRRTAGAQPAAGAEGSPEELPPTIDGT